MIKPPPPRLSWELLLEDYLKDPEPKLTSTPNVSGPMLAPTSAAFPQPFYDQPSTQENQNLLPFLPPPYPLPPRTTRSTLPPRRYQMTLDELVYLVSQVGRADLYREMVQYIKAQKIPLSSPSKPSPSPSPSPAQPRLAQGFNLNAHASKTSTTLFRSKEETIGQTTQFPIEVQDELIRKLHHLTMKKR